MSHSITWNGPKVTSAPPAKVTHSQELRPSFRWLSDIQITLFIQSHPNTTHGYRRLARGLGWPVSRLTGLHTAAAPKHSLCFSVQFLSNWSHALMYICKVEMLVFTD